MYRSSTGNLDRFESPPRGGERWDRDRFERMRKSDGRSDNRSEKGGRGDFEHYRFHEHDQGPGYHRDIDIHEDRNRRGHRVLEKERLHEDERYELPSRRRTDLFEEKTPSEIANQALTPYRRKSVVDRDINIDIDINSQHQSRPARPARPQYIRRQSSLDTYDRRPLPRYGDIERHERTEYRLPANVPIPLPLRERRRSPPRRFHEEDDFEEIRYADRGGRGRDQGYREVEVHREKSKVRRSKSAARSTRSSSISSFEEIQPARAQFGKRGRTRMPKRLVKKQAVIELGYPFEEEDDFIIITRALEKEHIDEVIKISETYQKEEKMTYVYEEKSEAPASLPPPPPPPESIAPPPPPPPVMHAPPPPPPPASVYQGHDHHGHEEYVEIERSQHMQHGGMLVRHPEHLRSERDIKDDIRALEEERRLLKYERDGEYEIIERRDPRREVLRVDRDRKGRLALVRSAH